MAVPAPDMSKTRWSRAALATGAYCLAGTWSAPTNIATRDAPGSETMSRDMMQRSLVWGRLRVMICIPSCDMQGRKPTPGAKPWGYIVESVFVFNKRPIRLVIEGAPCGSCNPDRDPLSIKKPGPTCTSIRASCRKSKFWDAKLQMTTAPNSNG